MRTIYILLFYTAQSATYSQVVEVSGFARDFKNNGLVQIIINDTPSQINKNAADLFLKNVLQNKYEVLSSDENGFFRLNAKISDTLVFAAYRSVSQKYRVGDLVSKGEVDIKLDSIPCVPYSPCQESPKNLLVFVGQKISVDVSDDPDFCNIISMDTKYKAKYEILEKVYGDFPRDTIDFVSYDHFSKIRYDYYDHVLLYVAEYCGKLVHLKYQYSPMFKTSKGKWIAPTVEDYDPTIRLGELKPHRVKVKEPIKIKKGYWNSKIEKFFLEPEFKIRNGQVYIKYGYYPHELFEMKKNYLKQFGFFNQNCR